MPFPVSRPSLRTPWFRARGLLSALVVLSVAAGCATRAPEAPPRPVEAEPPPPNVNLSGFPLPYRQGYADGCASVGATQRKDGTRYAADGNYRTGWDDGRAICGRR